MLFTVAMAQARRRLLDALIDPHHLESKRTQGAEWAGPPLRAKYLNWPFKATPAFGQFVPSRSVATRELHTSLKVVVKLQRLLNEQVAT